MNAPLTRWYGSLPYILSDLGIGVAVGGHEPIRYTNEAFCALTGYSGDELLAGRTLAQLLDADVGLIPVEQCEASGFWVGAQKTELLNRHVERVPVEIAGAFLEIDGEMAFVGTFRDLRSQNPVEAELAARARQQAVVAELGRHALVDPDVSVLIELAVEAVRRTLAVELVEVLELLPDGQALLLLAGAGWPEDLVGLATVAAGPEYQVGYTLAADGPVAATDLSCERRFGVPPLLLERGVRGSLTVVIRGEPQPFGVLGAYTTEIRAFTDDDVHFLRAVANVVADAVARARIEGELATRARQQAAVVELGRRRWWSATSRPCSTPPSRWCPARWVSSWWRCSSSSPRMTYWRGGRQWVRWAG